MMYSLTLCVSSDHPALAGHFPGAPVVPGVVLLDEIRKALCTLLPDTRILALQRIKFLKPWLPEEHLQLHLNVDIQKEICRFRCERDCETIAQGDIRLSSAS